VICPYEAFSLGGSNSVRGDEGEVGSGRSFRQQLNIASRFFAVVGGALFVDVGTDLGTGNVPGDPAGARKTGSGIGTV